MLEKIVSWTNQAYRDIQRLKSDWDFRQTSKSFNTISGTDTYLAQVSDVAEIDLYKVSLYLTDSGDETVLKYLPFDDFYNTYKVRNQTDNRPVYFTIADDHSIVLGPQPDDIYNVTFYYTKIIESMSANADEPDFKEAYHEAIVWKACIYYATHEEAFDFLKMATSNYSEILKLLKRYHTSSLTLRSSPLA